MQSIVLTVALCGSFSVALCCNTAVCEQILSRDLCHFYQAGEKKLEISDIFIIFFLPLDEGNDNVNVDV